MDSLFFNIINTLFIRVVNLSFSSIILIIALLTIRYLFKKIPHKIILFLWILVGARLIIPFSIENEIGIAPSINTFTYSSHTGATTSISSNINAIDEPVNNILESTQSTSSTLSTLSIICTILTIIWLVGIITFISHGFIGYFRLRKITSNATRLQYNIFQCDNITSPFILGMFEPIIYLPTKLPKETLNHVMTHEQVHLERKDHITKSIAYFILCLHWFNPIIWIAYNYFCKDIELACDEKVIEKCNMNLDERKAYATTLLECSINNHSLLSSHLAFGEVAVKTRILNVLGHKKRTLLFSVSTLFICILILLFFLSTPMGIKINNTKNGKNILSNVKNIEVNTITGNYSITKSDEIKEFLNILDDIRLKYNNDLNFKMKQNTATTTVNIYHNDDTFETLSFNNNCSNLIITIDDSSNNYSVANVNPLNEWFNDKYQVQSTLLNNIVTNIITSHETDNDSKYTFAAYEVYDQKERPFLTTFTSDADSIISLYIVNAFINYTDVPESFENDATQGYTGCGPAVVTVKLNKNGEYSEFSYVKPIDGDDFGSSFKRQFTRKAYNQCKNYYELTPAIFDKLEIQVSEYFNF